ncbi:hypothetical protein GQ43DRAFT_474994 [Delitschia confertaspora ATCC 74209]|uniref:Uncharacterized protein n=1 Tax=Delitschia confertaspora ATCC 74209 TaxID=1513339 RepID=A0A9P4JIR2_9PLEO|nr:hypothetical protein GQ43DRAFT_474994 [Delitschia confertaspora ATCC 74209]
MFVPLPKSITLFIPYRTHITFAQELLSTFSTQIGEIALIPATGGLFTVELTYIPEQSRNQPSECAEGARKVLLWDRKEKGGFPETKVLKQLVRDHIDPSKDLGHSDRHGKKKKPEEQPEKSEEELEGHKEAANASASQEKSEGGGVDVKRNPDGTVCEDCR